MKKIVLFVLVLTFVIANTHPAFTAEKILYSFEADAQGWEIPDWAYEQEEYVGEELSVSKEVAKEGNSSLKLMVNFPGGRWYGAIAEIMEYFDWTPYSTISCDVYLPENGPGNLRAKIVLTVGESWRWTEMSRSVRLIPGEWASIKANLKPGSMDWRRTNVTDEFRADVRKIAIRIESNGIAYTGPVYIDNVLLSE